HVSAYALIIEDGTKLERQIRRGEVAAPDDDLQADMYELADGILSEAGYAWYEVSNWAREPSQRSRHNLSYWQGADWWGYGPGAPRRGCAPPGRRAAAVADGGGSRGVGAARRAASCGGVPHRRRAHRGRRRTARACRAHLARAPAGRRGRARIDGLRRRTRGG